MNSLTQSTVQVNGIVYDESIREYRVIVDGVTVNYATHYGTACYQQAEALRIRRDHIQAGNSWGGEIPFSGEPVPTEEWADDYGLELPA